MCWEKHISCFQVSLQSPQWKPHFASGLKWICNRTVHICFPIFVKFGTKRCARVFRYLRFSWKSALLSPDFSCDLESVIPLLTYRETVWHSDSKECRAMHVYCPTERTAWNAFYMYVCNILIAAFLACCLWRCCSPSSSMPLTFWTPMSVSAAVSYSWYFSPSYFPARSGPHCIVSEYVCH